MITEHIVPVKEFTTSADERLKGLATTQAPMAYLIAVLMSRRCSIKG